MNVISVVRALHISVIFNCIKEHILERNPKNVINLVRPLYIELVFNCIKENILERRKPYECNECDKAIASCSCLQLHKKHILERNPMIVIILVRHLQNRVIFKYTKDHRVERTTMNVVNVVRRLETTVLFMVIKEHKV